MTKREYRSLEFLRRLLPSRRGWPGLPGVAWLDVKLGLRLLAKYPGMTFAACFALAIGIPVGLVPLQMNAALNATPPFHEGDRLRGI